MTLTTIITEASPIIGCICITYCIVRIPALIREALNDTTNYE